MCLEKPQMSPELTSGVMVQVYYPTQAAALKICKLTPKLRDILSENGLI